jgi:hypothetical protein
MTAKVPDQDAIIGNGYTAMASGDLGKVDPEVAFRMSTDEQDRTLQWDWRQAPALGGDELVAHSAPFSGAWTPESGTGGSLWASFSPAIWTIT